MRAASERVSFHQDSYKHSTPYRDRAPKRDHTASVSTKARNAVSANLSLAQRFPARRFSTSIFSDNPREKFYKVRMTPELKNSLAEIDNLKVIIRERRAKTNGNLLKAIQDKLRFSWTYNSNAIEGSKLTLGDTIFFLQEGLTVGGKPFKDFLDAKNHSEAIDYLYDVVTKKMPIDPPFLKQMNAILLKGVDFIPGVDAQGKRVQKQLTPGRYKTEPNYVLQPDGTIHNYVEPEEVAYQIDELCDWLRESEGNEHAVIRSGIAHYNKVRIHPFQDGNGRGARLLKNLVLLRGEYYPAIIEVERRLEYLKALKEADKGNLVPFIQFTADAVFRTQRIVLDEVENYLASKAAPPTTPKLR